MATTSLPSRPDLERFRRDARELQRAVRAGHAGAIHLVAAHHPGGAPTDPAAFPLSAAQLVTARRYGLSSWPKLVAYLQVSRVWSRDPVTVLDDSLAPADEFAALACLTYSDLDDPQRWHRAATRLRNDPALPARSLAAAAVAGDPDALQRHLIEQPATAEVGPFGWVPLLYVVYSRIPQRDPLGTVQLLLEAGADPDSGYLWLGLPTPFTGLTGCFGEGEQGPGRQPRHPQGEQLAHLLLEHGAEANDGQALYNRMFGRDDSHLRLLFDYGLGTGDGGVWKHRIGEAIETPTEMMDRQLDWAVSNGFAERLDLLADHGHRPATAPVAILDIHRAGAPERVAEMVAAGADVNAFRNGRTALHHHAWIGDADMVVALLEAGANPNLVDGTYGTTPLGWAEHGHQPETAGLLVAVTDSGLDRDGDTVIAEAAPDDRS